MPYKNHEEMLEHHRNYYYANRERIRENQKKYREKNREKYNAMTREHHRKKKLEVLIHYGGNHPKCACCGEDIIEFLTIDHIYGGGTQHRNKVGYGYKFYQWLIKNNFPDGFQVLCRNCNWAKSHGGCPHITEMMQEVRSDG